MAQAALGAGGRWVNLAQSAGGTAGLDAAPLRHRQLRLSGFSATALPADRVAAAWQEVAAIAGRGGLPLPVSVHPLADVADVWAAQAASPGGKLVLRP